MQKAANISTVVAAIVAAASMGFGVYQFHQTQRLTRETLRIERDIKAVELFLKFNEAQQEIASKPVPRKGDAAFWRHNALLTQTETVFRLTREDPGWEETVTWMLEIQRPFLSQTEFRCKSFHVEFLKRMQRAAPSLKCLSGAA